MADKAYRKLVVLALVLVFGVSAAAWAHNDGEILWSYLTGAATDINSSPVIGPDGTIYIGGADGQLYALNPDGSLRWVKSGLFLGLSSPAIGNDGTIYFGSFTNLYAVTPDGALKWTFSTGDIISSSPAIGDGGHIYFGSADRNLYALSSDGSEVWHFETGGPISSSPATHEGNVYFGSADGKVYAVHWDGTEQWHYQTGGNVDCSPAVGQDGTIYVGSNDGKLYAFSPFSANNPNPPLWTFTAGGAIGSSPVIDTLGRICFGANDGKLYVVDPTTHTNAAGFPFSTGGSAVSSSPAIASDGTIYVGTFGAGMNRLYALTPAGAVKSGWPVAIGVANSSPMIGMDGALYVGSTNGRVYSVFTTGGQPAYGWPMFHRDAFHTGNTRPKIGQTLPAMGQTDVPVNVEVKAFFSVPMSASSILNSFTVNDGIHNIAGTVNYDEFTRSATFTPSAALVYGRQYAATITSDATDIQGVPVSGPYGWYFTVIPRFTITAAAGPHGTISPPGNTLVVKGQDQAYTITPNEHYHILDVQKDGESVFFGDPSQPFHYTFTDVTADHQIVALFTIDTYAITSVAGPGGTIGPSGDVVVNYGASQTFDIIPAPGFHIVDVVVDGLSIGVVDSYTFDNVTNNDHSIAAFFGINQYTIAASVGGGGGGTITPNGAVLVNQGASQTFLIAPSTGYHIQDVVVNGSSVGAVNSYTFNNVTANGLTIQANFVNHPPIADAGPDQIVFEGQTVFLNAGGSSDPDGDTKTYFWSQLLPGAHPIVLSSSTSRNPSFVAPPVNADTVLTFEVQVTDPAGASDTDTVVITVRDNGLAGFPAAATTLISSTGRPVGLALNAGIGVSADLVSVLPISPDDIPDEVNKPGLMPYGLFELIVNVDPAGSAVQVTFYFPEPLPPGFVWYKHLPPPLGWINFNAQVVYNANRTQATVTLVDGGAGDADGAANGTIVDPSGPAFVPGPDALAAALTGGELPSAYKVLAVPLTLGNTSPAAFFGGQIGNYDTGQERIFGWNAATQSFQEFPNVNNLAPGTSVWIISRQNRQISFNGLRTTVSEGPLERLGFGLPIMEGWNLIGNPFSYEISVERIVVAQGVEAAGLTSAENHLTQPVFWVWRNGGYVQAQTLLPGEGGWLLKLVPGQGTAFFDALPAGAAAAARQTAVREALEQPPAPPQALPEGGGGLGGGGAGGGCFVSSVGRPGQAGVAFLLLVVVGLAGAAWVGRRRRS